MLKFIFQALFQSAQQIYEKREGSGSLTLLYLQQKIHQALNKLSRPTYSTVILLWRKFIYDKSTSGMLINPRIVFTFTRKSWSNTTFSSYLALLVWRSNMRNLPHPPTSFISQQNKLNPSKHRVANHKIKRREVVSHLSYIWTRQGKKIQTTFKIV